MKQLIEDYKKKIETLTNDLRLYKSTGSINDIKKVERLTTKLFEYRAFVAELEHALIQEKKKEYYENVQEDRIYKMLGGIQKENVQLSDETPKLVSLIDFSMLRTQKKTLIEIIDDMEKKNAEYYKNDVTNLDGILNLIDCIQDFAVDVVGLNPIDVFDFELEENREDIVKPNKLFDALEPVIDVIDVIERKKQGIDCTEAESAEIKGYLRELKRPEEQQIVAVIQLLFPIEYGEFLDEV